MEKKPQRIYLKFYLESIESSLRKTIITYKGEKIYIFLACHQKVWRIEDYEMILKGN